MSDHNRFASNIEPREYFYFGLKFLIELVDSNKDNFVSRQSWIPKLVLQYEDLVSIRFCAIKGIKYYYVNMFI